MDKNLESVIEKRIFHVIKALKKNRMEGYLARNQEELINLINTFIGNDKLITTGGSMSLEEIGITDFLRACYPNAYISRENAKSPEEANEIMRKAFISDTFITSTNAITEDGELYNVDGRGNRVSAMVFGPKQVIIVAGYNKIVSDIDEAISRVEKTAAPSNAARLKCKTPCAETGVCMHCNSPDRICCSFVRMGQQREEGRIKVILMPISLGY